MSENKHLTLDERNFIEQELTKNTSFREIAKYLSKDPITISREVKKHRIRKEEQSILIILYFFLFFHKNIEEKN